MNKVNFKLIYHTIGAQQKNDEMNSSLNVIYLHRKCFEDFIRINAAKRSSSYLLALLYIQLSDQSHLDNTTLFEDIHLYELAALP